MWRHAEGGVLLQWELVIMIDLGALGTPLPGVEAGTAALHGSGYHQVDVQSTSKRMRAFKDSFILQSCRKRQTPQFCVFSPYFSHLTFCTGRRAWFRPEYDISVHGPRGAARRL